MTERSPNSATPIELEPVRGNVPGTVTGTVTGASTVVVATVPPCSRNVVVVLGWVVVVVMKTVVP